MKSHTEYLVFDLLDSSVNRTDRPTWEMAISFPVRLGRRLSDLREKRGLSQTQLADMAGIGRAHLSQIETEQCRLESIRSLLSLRRSN